MIGSVVQVNISRGGIPKLPVPEAEVGPLGLEGDTCAHPQFHGGPNQAILLICAEAVDELRALGYSVYYGALGENLTVSGIDYRELRAGQQYRAGSIIFELTKVRVPCNQLSPLGAGIQQEIYDKRVKAGDPGSPRWGRSGFYAKVIQPGRIRTGDAILLAGQAA